MSVLVHAPAGPVAARVERFRVVEHRLIATATGIAVFLALQWQASLRTVLSATRSALAAGYSRMDMVGALRMEAARKRKRASTNNRFAPLASRRRRRATYAAVGLPLVVLGTWLGRAFPPPVEDTTIKRLAFGLLLAMGVWILGSAFLLR